MQGYMHKAIECLDRHGSGSYPVDELQWLVITSWEEGIEALDRGDKSCALRFFEIALRLRSEVNGPLCDQVLEMWDAVANNCGLQHVQLSSLEEY
ncbi:hypothetical protein BT69DRAFT_1089671 [Atractiella rhizophila]|nr:hypothetical protein BT69DRAFT_1089671 [Atractiella rhizophila]